MQLICAFVFAYSKSRFSLDAAHMAVEVWLGFRLNIFYCHLNTMGLGTNYTTLGSPLPGNNTIVKVQWCNRNTCVRNKNIIDMFYLATAEYITTGQKYLYTVYAYTL